MTTIATSEDLDATAFSTQRKLVRTSDGTLYAVYHKQLATQHQIYVAKSVNGGATWTNATRISTYAGMESYYQWAASIAVDSNDHLHVVWIGRATGYTTHIQVWYAKYTTSWAAPVRISTYDGMDSYHQNEPSITIDSNNYLHVVWVGPATGYESYNQVWYAKYDTSWATPIRISTYAGMESHNQLTASIAVDNNNNLHVVWAGTATGYAGANQIWYAKYTTSWATPIRISTYAGMQSCHQYLPTIAVDSSNYLHVVWHGYVTTYVPYYHIWYAKYDTSWTTPVYISTYAGMESYHQSFPSIAVDSNNYLHVVWHGKATGYTDYDKVWYARYDTSWINPTVLQATGQNIYPNFRWSRYPTSNQVTTRLDYVFTNGTTSPCNIMFDYLTLIESYTSGEQIAKIGVEIFSSPCLFDDNFVNDWTTEGGATFVTDGDIVELKCTGSGDYDALYTFSVAKNTNPNRYLTVLATALTGTSWSVKIYSGATLKVSKTYTDTGIKEIDLYAENSNVHFDYDKVRLWINGSINQYVRFDYIIIGDAPMFVPTTNSDIIDDLQVTAPVLSRGISGLKTRIFNPDGTLTGKAAEHDVILVYLWREGNTQKKIFGGRIVAPGSDASLDANEYYITIDAHDHGWELNRPPSLVDTVYIATNGKTIIEAAIDKCVYLTKKFVDVENDIVSMHSVEFLEVTPGKVVNDISKAAVDGSGNVGVDGYIDPAGNTNIFKRGKYNSPVTPTILGYKLTTDLDRIINKQRVYGEASKLYPAGADLCESLTPTEGEWTAVTGSSHVYLEDAKQLFGTYSIRGQLESAGPTFMLRFTFNAGYEPDCSYPPNRRYGKIFGYIWLDDTWQTSVWIVLCDDAGKRVTRYIKTIYDDWKQLENGGISIGVKTVPDDWLLWPGDASFNWAKIAWVQFYMWTANGNDTGNVWIDGLHFGGRRYEGEYEDTTSQGLYGVRQAEPVIEDELKSDAECLNRATGIVQFYKDPVKTISDLRVAGDNRFLPGYIQHLVSAVDGIDASFRIIEVKHRIQFTYWITELILNNEPQEMSYLLNALFDKIRGVQNNAT